MSVNLPERFFCQTRSSTFNFRRRKKKKESSKIRRYLDSTKLSLIMFSANKTIHVILQRKKKTKNSQEVCRGNYLITGYVCVYLRKKIIKITISSGNVTHATSSHNPNLPDEEIIFPGRQLDTPPLVIDPSFIVRQTFCPRFVISVPCLCPVMNEVANEADNQTIRKKTKTDEAEIYDMETMKLK